MVSKRKSTAIIAYLSGSTLLIPQKLHTHFPSLSSACGLRKPLHLAHRIGSLLMVGRSSWSQAAKGVQRIANGRPSWVLRSRVAGSVVVVQRRYRALRGKEGEKQAGFRSQSAIHITAYNLPCHPIINRSPQCL